MAHIVFFEKPGCGGNAKQKAMLQTAGHTLDVRSLLSEPWTADRLRAFFGALPVSEWFNRAAPRVKSGDVQPESLTADAALALMLAEPLLIRRPLMQVEDQLMVGFDTAAVDAWVGLQAGTPARKLEGCAASMGDPCAAQGGQHAPD